MNYELPLVFFTALTQLAVGLSLVATWREYQNECIGIYSFRREWAVAFVASSLGLAASLFHLGDPMRAITALANLSHSWLSREGLVFGIFTLFALLNIFKRSRKMAMLTSCLGILGIIIQGMTYAPVSMPVISNAVPMIIFAFCALSLGTSLTQMAENDGISKVRTISLALLAILLVALPFVWKGGSALSQQTAELWLASAPFWASIACIVVALIMSLMGKRCILMGLIVLAGVLLSRMTFFADTLHTATRIGMPY